MKTLLTVCLLFAGSSLSSPAQDDQQMQTWMKTAGGAMGSLKKAVDAKSGSDATAAAKQLDTVFAEVKTYWAKRNADDAVKYSEDARTAANEVASAVESSGDTSSGFAKLGATCKGCHAGHREKAADGSYKIK